MGFVYLIGEVENEGKYKIGSTRGKSVSNRLKQLQTGNSSELFVKNAYETNKPFKLETMLHNHFKNKSLIGEWFQLDEADVNDFVNTCDKFQGIIKILKDNPFF